MSKRFIFPTPLDATVELRHDNGVVRLAVPDTHPSGRPGQSFDLAGLPNGNGAQITYTHPGYLPTVQRGVLYVSGTTLFDVDDVHLVPGGSVSGPESGPLRVNGLNFIDATGAPWFMKAYHVHVMPSKIYNGQDVGPIMDDAKAYGANTLAPICTHLSQWKSDHGYFLNPLADLGRWQGTLGVLFDMAAARGLRVAPMCLADCQNVSEGDRQRIWHAYCEVVKGRWNLIAVKWNEDLANGGNADHDTDLPDLGGVLASKGDRGVGIPPHQAFWNFVLWEARRPPDVAWHKTIDDAGAGIRELNHGYDGANGHVGPFNCPTVHFEPPVFNDTETDAAGDHHRLTDPKLALDLGLNAGANFAGIGFLGSEAMECRPLGPITAESCRQMFRGAQAAFLR